MSLDKSVEIKDLGLRVIGLFSQVAEALVSGEDLDDLLGKILDLVFKNLPPNAASSAFTTSAPIRSRAQGGALWAEVADEKISISRSIANRSYGTRRMRSWSAMRIVRSAFSRREERPEPGHWFGHGCFVAPLGQGHRLHLHRYA